MWSIASRLLTVVDERDWDTLPTLFTESARYDRPGFEPMLGRPAIDRFYREQRDVAQGKHSILGSLTDGEETCCWGEFIGITRTGRPIDEKFCDWYVLERGLIARRRTFFFRPAI